VATRELPPFVVPARAGTYCRGCEIVEYNPALDEDRRTAGVVGDVLAALFGPGVPPGAISRQQAPACAGTTKEVRHTRRHHRRRCERSEANQNGRHRAAAAKLDCFGGVAASQ
jgi:hypothetical protein